MPRRDDHEETVEQAGLRLWDVDEWVRLNRLAATYPTLLTYDEQKLYRLCVSILQLVNPSADVAPGNTYLQQRMDADFIKRHWLLLSNAAEQGLEINDVAIAIRKTT